MSHHYASEVIKNARRASKKATFLLYSICPQKTKDTLNITAVIIGRSVEDGIKNMDEDINLIRQRNMA